MLYFFPFLINNYQIIHFESLFTTFNHQVQICLTLTLTDKANLTFLTVLPIDVLKGDTTFISNTKN